jgi:hypothetical protein
MHRNALPTSPCDRVRSFSDRAAQPFGGGVFAAAARDVDGRTGLSEGKRNAPANAATGSRDNGNFSAQLGHR